MIVYLKVYMVAVKLNVIFSDNHTPYIDAKKVNLFKIHGDLSNPDSIIITESDY